MTTRDATGSEDVIQPHADVDGNVVELNGHATGPYPSHSPATSGRPPS